MAKKLKRDLTMEEQLARGPLDLPFLTLVLLLTGIGVIMVFSASYPTAIQEGASPFSYFIRQGLFAVGGVVIMFAVSKVNYQRFRWMSVFVLIGSIVLLVLVLIPGIGVSRGGAQRWIRALGPIPSFQPSEVAKVGVIMYFAARLSKRNQRKPLQFNRRSYLYGPAAFLERTGWDAVRAHEDALARRFYETVKMLSGVKVYGDFTVQERAPIVSLNIAGLDSSEVSDELAERFQIATRPGAHCAPRLHRALGTEDQGAVRFSWSCFNTEEETDAAAEAVRTLAGESV